MGVGQEISTYESAEEAPRKSEATVRALLAALPVLAFRVSNDGIFLDHAVAEKELSLLPKLRPGGAISEMMPAETATQVMRSVCRALRTKDVQVFELRLPTPPPDGDVLDYEASIVVCGEDEVLVILQDITERKRLEAQLLYAKKMEVVGRFVEGMAHDFNNLLTPIVSYADLAAGAVPVDTRLHNYLREIQKAGERASELSRQLLGFSRRRSMETKLLNLDDLVLNMHRMLRRLIGEDIEVVTLPAPHLGLIKADPGQLEQVLLNLVVNARDAMPDGRRLIIQSANVILDEEYVRRHPEAKPGEHVMLAVSDTGAGMAEEEVKARVFEPFFTTKESGKGTGLGLSTCYGIVRKSGGHLSVDSEPGEGTTFRIYLPAAGEVPESVALREEASFPAVGSETVLLVDDELVVREVVSHSLR